MQCRSVLSIASWSYRDNVDQNRLRIPASDNDDNDELDWTGLWWCFCSRSFVRSSASSPSCREIKRRRFAATRRLSFSGRPVKLVAASAPSSSSVSLSLASSLGGQPSGQRWSLSLPPLHVPASVGNYQALCARKLFSYLNRGRVVVVVVVARAAPAWPHAAHELIADICPQRRRRRHWGDGWMALYQSRRVSRDIRVLLHAPTNKQTTRSLIDISLCRHVSIQHPTPRTDYWLYTRTISTIRHAAESSNSTHFDRLWICCTYTYTMLHNEYTTNLMSTQHL